MEVSFERLVYLVFLVHDLKVEQPQVAQVEAQVDAQAQVEAEMPVEADAKAAHLDLALEAAMVVAIGHYCYQRGSDSEGVVYMLAMQHLVCIIEQKLVEKEEQNYILLHHCINGIVALVVVYQRGADFVFVVQMQMMMTDS